MTSPLSSLSKAKKSPLKNPPNYGKRQMPFRMPEYSSTERALLNDMNGHIPVTSEPSSSENSNDSPTITPRRLLMQPLNGSAKDMFDSYHNSLNGSKKMNPLGQVNINDKGDTPLSIPSDIDLMSSMMQKIKVLEIRNLYHTKEIIEKDKRIKILEDKTALMEKSMKSASDDSPSRVAELEAKCLELKQQIYEMESFLADYGMIWVGDKPDPNSSKYLDEDEERSNETTANSWKPEMSRIPENFAPDFDRIVENVKDLNIIAGEGESKIAKTSGGAKLEMTDPIQLCLYQNGIMMFNGPFRPYTDVHTQRCLLDIMDGYFPSELQSRYPDGIPINVTDRRFVTFQDSRLQEEFPGVGHMLGGEEQPSNLLKSNADSDPSSTLSSAMSARSTLISPTQSVASSNAKSSTSAKTPSEITSERPGPRLSAEQFTNKLPRSVIKNGKVIDVRASISERLSESHTSSSSAELIDTEVVKEMQERMSIPENERPPSARNVATLRVKCEDGSKTLLIKMKFEETIGDLRKYINKRRPGRKSPYNIVSTFPSRTYDDSSQTLLECGLVPNATLLLRNKKPSRSSRN